MFSFLKSHFILSSGRSGEHNFLVCTLDNEVRPLAIYYEYVLSSFEKIAASSRFVYFNFLRSLLHRTEQESIFQRNCFLQGKARSGTHKFRASGQQVVSESCEAISFHV